MKSEPIYKCQRCKGNYRLVKGKDDRYCQLCNDALDEEYLKKYGQPFNNPIRNLTHDH